PKFHSAPALPPWLIKTALRWILLAFCSSSVCGVVLVHINTEISFIPGLPFVLLAVQCVASLRALCPIPWRRPGSAQFFALAIQGTALITLVVTAILVGTFTSPSVTAWGMALVCSLFLF